MGVDVSVVVIGWNERPELNRHLDELSALSVPADTELVAVVGGGDGTYARYSAWCGEQDQFDAARCLEQAPSDGYAGALERGLEAADGQRVLTLEMDTGVRPEWIHAVLSGLENHDAVTCAGTPRNGVSFHWAYQWIDQRRDIQNGVPQLSGAQTMGFRRAVVDEVLLADPLPRTLVDWRLSRRLIEAGFSTGMVDRTTVVVSHVEKRSSFRHFVKMQQNSLAGLGVAGLVKQGSIFTAVSAAPILLAATALASVLFGAGAPIPAAAPAVFVVLGTVGRDLNAVRVASKADRTAWLVLPLYVGAKQLLYVARMLTAWRLLVGRSGS